MSEMVERVARAIYEKNHLDKWPGDLSELHREVFIRCAEAAIAAMREPTEAMALTGAKEEAFIEYYKDNAWDRFVEPEDQPEWIASAAAVWRAMIDAVLQDEVAP